MKPLIWDTETNKMILWKDPSESPDQPHIVELAALLYDDNGNLIDKMHRIVRPDGWVIPADVVEIHGITTERAMDEGVPEPDVIAEFLALQQRAEMLVAHNATFDNRMARITIKRFGDGRAMHALLTKEEKDAIADSFKSRPSYCTMKASTVPCNLPGKKWPKLAEAYRHYFNEELVGAHSALVDALACARIYFAIQGVGA